MLPETYFATHCTQIWKRLFVLFFVLRVFYYDWVNLLPTLGSFLVVYVLFPCALVCGVLFILSMIRVMRQTRRAQALLCSLLLLLPWTTLYEAARFYTLRPWMETVAQMLAAENAAAPMQGMEALRVALPPGARVLSRQGAVYFAPTHEGIVIAFIKHGGGLFTCSEEYVYRTKTAYRGAGETGGYYPDPFDVRGEEALFPGWSVVKIASVMEQMTA